jgi:hypothetical protein
VVEGIGRTRGKSFFGSLLVFAGRFERDPKIGDEISVLAFTRFLVWLPKERGRMNRRHNFCRELRRQNFATLPCDATMDRRMLVRRSNQGRRVISA